MPSLSEVLKLDPVSAAGDTASYLARIDPVFTIGPKVHGGTLQALSAEAAVRAYVDLAGEPVAPPAPVAVSTNYLGAPDPAEVQVTVRLVKRGRRTSFADVAVSQNGREAVRSTVTLGTVDAGPVRHSAPAQIVLPVEPTADAFDVAASPMGSIVHLAGALDFYATADMAEIASGKPTAPVMTFWARPKGDVDPDIPFAILCGDISAPTVMKLQLFGWAPTVALTTFVRRAPAPGWLRIAVRTEEVGRGWFDELCTVTDSTGRVVVQSQQLAIVPTTV